MLGPYKIQANRAVVLIYPRIKFCKPRHAKEHLIVQFGNNMKLNYY